MRRLLRWPVGSVPLVVLVLLLTFLLSSCQGGRDTSPPAGKPPLSVPSADVLGLKWNRSQTATLDYAARTGGGFTFSEVEWCEVESRPGQLNWKKTDVAVDQSDSLDHRMMLKIRTGQCWATEEPVVGSRDRTEAVRKTPSTLPRDMGRYEDFVRALVSRYAARGVHVFAIENEPDVLNFWGGSLADYETLVRAAARVVRATDPDARVLDGGLSSTGYGVVMAKELMRTAGPEAALGAYNDYYRRRIEGGASRWPSMPDAASLTELLDSTPVTRTMEAMAANTRLVTDGVVDAYQLHFYEDTDELDAVIRMIRSQIGDAPIEAWEVGVAWPGDTFDAEEAAAETTRLVSTLLAQSITPIVYLPLAYTPRNGPQVFRGLVDEQGKVLPSGQAYLLLASIVARTQKNRYTPVSTPGRDLRGVIMETADAETAVLWSDGANDSVDLDPDERATDYRGRQLDDPATSLGRSPIVVTATDGGLSARLLADR